MRLYPHNGYWWVGAVIAGKLYLLRRAGRIGDVIKP